MSDAIIYKPTKSAMQSAKSNPYWYLQFKDTYRESDSIMGWTSSSDMKPQQLKLKFSSLNAAVEYAKSNGIDFEILKEQERTKKHLKPYAKNFSF